MNRGVSNEQVDFKCYHREVQFRISLATYGLLKFVVTDNGGNLVNREFEDFLKQNGIDRARATPYRQASKEMADEAVQTFKEEMKKLNGGSVTKWLVML